MPLVSQCKPSFAQEQNPKPLKPIVTTYKAKTYVFNGFLWAQKGKLKWRAVEVHIIPRSFLGVKREG